MTKYRLGGASPFNDGAMDKWKRMGLILADGSANLGDLQGLARVYSGLLYDRLREETDKSGDCIMELCSDIVAPNMDVRKRLLAICVRYDAMHMTLPEPIWWISGSRVLYEPFTHAFAAHLIQLCREQDNK